MFRSILTDKLFLLAFSAALFFWTAYFFLLPVTAAIYSGQTVFKFMMAVLAYPILEEAAFRGFVQTSLLSQKFASASRMGISVANIITSLLFVLIHTIYHPLIWALAVFFPSMVFGFFRDRHGSILPGMILHIWYNAGFFLLYFFV